MVPIKFNEVDLFLKQATVKLKYMQKNKTVDMSMVMSLRLFIVGLLKLLRYFRNFKPPEGGASVTYRVFDFKSWDDISKQQGRVLKPILNRQRYANLSRTFVLLKKLNKNLTPELEPVYFILLLMFVIETYAILMFISTALVDPTFLKSPTTKETVRSMLAFRRKMTVPFEYYNNLNDDPNTENRITNSLDSMKPFLGKNLRALIAFNKKLV